MNAPRPKKILLFALKGYDSDLNIQDALSKAGFSVDFETDPERCREKLANGYYHLAILRKEFLKGVTLTEGEDCYSRVEKWRLSGRSENKKGARGKWLEQIGFKEEIFTYTKVNEIIRKIKVHFEHRFQSFNWNLAIRKDGRPFHLFGLLEEIAHAEANAWAQERVEELEDLVGTAYYGHSNVRIFYPALWVEGGLAVLEVWAGAPANHVKRTLLVIGKTEAVRQYVESHDRCGEDHVPGSVQRLGQTHTINAFSAAAYQVFPLSGTIPLCRLSNLMESGHNPGELAEKLLAFYRHAPEGYFAPIPGADRVNIFSSLHAWLDLPDIEVVINNVIEKIGLLETDLAGAFGIAVQVDQPSEIYGCWIVNVSVNVNESSFAIDPNQLRMAFQRIKQNTAQGQAVRTPGRLYMRTMLVERRKEAHYLWPGDFRTPDGCACHLITLTQLEAEIRYEVGQLLNFLEWLDLEKALIHGMSEAGEEGSLSLGREARVIYSTVQHLYDNNALPNDTTKSISIGDSVLPKRPPVPRDLRHGDNNHQSAMLLHALARLVHIEKQVLHQESAVTQTLILLASISALVEKIVKPTSQRLINLVLKGPKTSTIDGKPLGLTPTEFKILAFMHQQPDGKIDPESFKRNICNDKSKVDGKRDLTNEVNFQKHVNNLRKKINQTLDLSQNDPLLIYNMRTEGYFLNKRLLAPNTDDS